MKQAQSICQYDSKKECTWNAPREDKQTMCNIIWSFVHNLDSKYGCENLYVSNSGWTTIQHLMGSLYPECIHGYVNKTRGINNQQSTINNHVKSYKDNVC